MARGIQQTTPQDRREVPPPPMSTEKKRALGIMEPLPSESSIPNREKFEAPGVQSTAVERRNRRNQTARFFGPEHHTPAIDAVFQSFRLGQRFTIGQTGWDFIKNKRAQDRGSPITEEEFYEHDLDLYGNLEWQPDMTTDSYEFLKERKIEELAMLYEIENAGGGFGTQALAMLAGMVGSVAHPVDVGAMFLPTGVGKAAQTTGAAVRVAKIMGKSVPMTRVGNVARQFQTGFKSGLVTAAWAEPLIYTGQQQLQADYSLVDSALNFTFSPFASGLMHAPFGAFGKKLRPETRELMSREAMFSGLFGEDRGPVMANLYRLDPEVYSNVEGVNRLKRLQRVGRQRALTDREFTEAFALVQRTETGRADLMASDPFRKPKVQSQTRRQFDKAFADSRTRAPRDAVETNIQNLVNVIDPNTKVRFYDGVYEANAYGAVLPSDPSTIYIARQRADDMTHVLGHEFSHSLKWRAPELWKEVVDTIDRAAGADASIRQAVRDAVNTQGAAFSKLHPAKRLDEAYANIMGDLFQSHTFWRELRKNRPTAFNKIVSWLKGVLRDVRARIARDPLLRFDQPEKMQRDIASILARAEEIAPVRSDFWKPGDFAQGKKFLAKKHEFFYDMNRFRGVISGSRARQILSQLDEEQMASLSQAMSDAHYEFAPLMMDAAFRKGEPGDWEQRMRTLQDGREVMDAQKVDFRLSQDDVDKIRANARNWVETQHPRRRSMSAKEKDDWVEGKVLEESSRTMRWRAARYYNETRENIQYPKKTVKETDPETGTETTRTETRETPEALFGRWPVFHDDKGKPVTFTVDKNGRFKGDPSKIREIRFFRYRGGEMQALEDASGQVEAMLRYGDPEAFGGRGPFQEQAQQATESARRAAERSVQVDRETRTRVIVTPPARTLEGTRVPQGEVTRATEIARKQASEQDQSFFVVESEGKATIKESPSPADVIRARVVPDDTLYNRSDFIPDEIQNRLLKFESLNKNSPEARAEWAALLEEPEFAFFHRWISGQPKTERRRMLTDYETMLEDFDEAMKSEYFSRFPDVADTDFNPFFRNLEVINDFATGVHVSKKIPAKVDRAMREFGLTPEERRNIGPFGPTPEQITRAWRKFVASDVDAKDIVALQRMVHFHLSGQLSPDPKRPWMAKLGQVEDEAMQVGRLKGESSYDSRYLDDPSAFDRATAEEDTDFGLVDSDLETDIFRSGEEHMQMLAGIADHRPMPLDMNDSLDIALSERRGKRFKKVIDSMTDQELDTVGERLKAGARAFIDDEGNLVVREAGQADNTYRWTEDPERAAYRRDANIDEADLMAARPNYTDEFKARINELINWERTARSRPTLEANMRQKALRNRLETISKLEQESMIESAVVDKGLEDWVVRTIDDQKFLFPTKRLTPDDFEGEFPARGTWQRLVNDLGGIYGGKQNYFLVAKNAVDNKAAVKAKDFESFKRLVNQSGRVTERIEASLKEMFFDLRALHNRHRGNAEAMKQDLKERVSREMAAEQLAAIRQFDAEATWIGRAKQGKDIALSFLDGAFRRGSRGGRGQGNNVWTSSRHEMADTGAALISTLQKNDAWQEFRQNGQLLEDVISHLETGGSNDPRVKEIADVIRLINDNWFHEVRSHGASTEYLPDFAFSQKWDQYRVKNVSFDQFANDMKEALDWERMAQYNGRIGRYDENTGQFVFDDLEGYLKSVYDDIRTGRWRERDTPEAELLGGNVARQISEHRTLLFKPGNAFRMDMKYGSGNTGQAIISQIARRSEMLALMRELGPSFNRTRETVAQALDSRRGQVENLKNFEKIVDPTGSMRWRMIFNKITGESDRPQNLALGKTGKTMRQFADVTVLGQSTITAFSMDPAHMADQLRWMGMPLNDAYVNIAKSIAEGARRRARLDNLDADAMLMGHGAGFDAFINAASRRFGGELSDFSLIGRLHSRFFDINGMNTWNTIGQQAVIDVTQRHFGDMAMRVRKGQELPEQFVNALNRFDITPEEFRAMAEVAKPYPVFMGERTQANAESWLNGPRIVKSDIADPALARKYGNFLDEAMRFGILEPTATESAYLNLGLQAGTPAGEAVRLITKYMNFPLAVARKTYRRMLNGYGEDGMRELNRMGLTQGTVGLMQFMPVLLMGSATALGIKDILAGRDPVGDITPSRMTRILDNSGALSILPDVLGYRPVPPVSTAANFMEGALSADFYKTTNAVMDSVPGNNLPLINEGKKAIMATMFEDWYGANFEARLQFFEREYGTSSVLQQ